MQTLQKHDWRLSAVTLAVAALCAIATPTSAEETTCGSTQTMAVHFYDVGQGLAVLVALPDGRHILVDAGDTPSRRGCGTVCAVADRHLLERLATDLHGAPIDLLWITHQHSDHIGGAAAVLRAFKVLTYVDNGRDAAAPEVRRTHDAAHASGAIVSVRDPSHAGPPLADAAGVMVRVLVPAAWPASCARDANDCSIGLRVDFCGSSIVFTGDAEGGEEAVLDTRGPTTLIQVGHHGSSTSSSLAFIARTHPAYAVISSGHPAEGLNLEYCHPRSSVVERLTAALGGAGALTLRSFAGGGCAHSTSSDWADIPVSDHLWSTARDGDVVLTTHGNGIFVRVP